MLAGAKIGGVLGLREARLAGGSPALDGYRLEVHVGMQCVGLRADGGLRLIGAHIRGQLDLSGARLRNTDDAALGADGVQIDQDLFCRSDSDGQRFEADGELRVIGAHIGGQFDLRGAHLSNVNGTALNAEGVQIDQDLFCRGDDDGQRFETDGELSLIGAHIGGMLDASGARLTNTDGRALNAPRLHVDQSMYCRGDVGGQRFEADGELGLLNAHISGQLDLSGARLSNANGIALNADGIEIGEHLICRCDDDDGQRFEADGELSLLGSHVAGQLDLRGAHLSNADGRALNADGLRVDQDLICRKDETGQRFEAEGELRLIGAHIGGQLTLLGARLRNAYGPVLHAEGLQVDQDMYCYVQAGDRFETDGEVSLLGAQIGGQLDLSGARLSNARGLALDFERGRASRLTLPRLADRDASVDLAHAEVSQFDDDPAPASPGESGYLARVTGLTYHSLGPNSGDSAARLAWLSRATDGYVPQAYDQLAEAYRRAGLDDDAKTVMIAKQVRRRETLGTLGKVVSVTLGAPVGYGYRTWRAAAALLALVVIGWIVFSLAHPAHMTATRPEAQLPDFRALLYSLDAVLPVVNLGQEISWSPQGVAHYWYGFSALVGWLLGLGLVAFLTARFFRE